MKMIIAAACCALAATPALAFDMRSPRDVLAVVTANGASGQLKTDDDGVPYIEAKAGSTNFEVIFQDCNAAKSSCSVVYYSAAWGFEKATLAQVNSWNSTAINCPAYLDKDSRLNAWMPLSATGHETAQDAASNQETWIGCLDDLDHFANEPSDYLRKEAS